MSPYREPCAPAKHFVPGQWVRMRATCPRGIIVGKHLGRPGHWLVYDGNNLISVHRDCIEESDEVLGAAR